MAEWRIARQYETHPGQASSAVAEIREYDDDRPGSRYICTAPPQDAEQIVADHHAAALLEQERRERAAEVAGLRAALEAKTLAVNRARSHLYVMHIHSSSSHRQRELDAAEAVLNADANETIQSLIVNAQHLEWVAEQVSRQSDTVGKTARICLERFRQARDALSRPPASDGEGAGQ